MSRHGSVSIVTGLQDGQPENPRIHSRRGQRFFASPPCPHWLSGPPSLLSNGYGALSRGDKPARRKVGYWPLSNVDIKNAWRYTSKSSYVSMAWCSIKHRDNFVSAHVVFTAYVLLYLIPSFFVSLSWYFFYLSFCGAYGLKLNDRNAQVFSIQKFILTAAVTLHFVLYSCSQKDRHCHV
jgi:hypothetical protein